MTVQSLKEKVLGGGEITREEALFLAESEVGEVALAADEIRRGFLGEDFDVCGVISVKSGRCSEDCRFCAQSTCACEAVEARALLSTEEILEHARLRDSQGVRHYCVVSVGRMMGDAELWQICESMRVLRRETGLSLCASLGLLDEQRFEMLREAGVERVHNNLEVSRRYFPSLCSSHTYEDKVQTLWAAKRAGLEICCGGIIGVGETMEDRIDMALEIRKFDVQSVPINLLRAVRGTPFEGMPHLPEEVVQKVIAIFRFLLPRTYVRLAAGRNFLSDSGMGCFCSGANAAITGDMLTFRGITVETDLERIRGLGYQL